MDLIFVQNMSNLVLKYFNLVLLSTPDSTFFRKGKMDRLKKWDQNVLARGNKEKWRSSRSWFGVSEFVTQFKAIGAWGRKRNLIWMGSWKGDNE